VPAGRRDRRSAGGGRGWDWRRAVRAAATAAILAGALVLADVGATLLWQEPVTAVVNHLRQRALEDDLARAAPPAPRRVLAELADDRARMAFLARTGRRRLRSGEAAARLRIPRIGLRRVVVLGTDHDALARGPGFYPSQPLPGAPGTAAIAGHRTTYGAPFRHIDRLRRGDRITVELPWGTVDYRVTHQRSVTPDALWVLDRRRRDALILSACDPPFSAARRLIVFATIERARIAELR